MTASDWNAFTRGLAIGKLMAEGREMTTAFIIDRFGVSASQAKRDMVMIEWALKADRTAAHARAKATLKLARGHRAQTEGESQ